MKRNLLLFHEGNRNLTATSLKSNEHESSFSIFSERSEISKFSARQRGNDILPFLFFLSFFSFLPRRQGWWYFHSLSFFPIIFLSWGHSLRSTFLTTTQLCSPTTVHPSSGPRLRSRHHNRLCSTDVQAWSVDELTAWDLLYAGFDDGVVGGCCGSVFLSTFAGFSRPRTNTGRFPKCNKTFLYAVPIRNPEILHRLRRSRLPSDSVKL